MIPAVRSASAARVAVSGWPVMSAKMFLGGGRGDDVVEGGGYHFGHVGSGYCSAGVELPFRRLHDACGYRPLCVAAVPGVFFYIVEGWCVSCGWFGARPVCCGPGAGRRPSVGG